MAIFRTKGLTGLFYPLALSSLSLNWVINMQMFPEFMKYQGAIQASYTFNRKADHDAGLTTYGYGQFEPYFYAKTPSDLAQDSTALRSVINPSDQWLIVDEAGLQDLLAMKDIHIDYQEEFPYKKMKSIDWPFLNPDLRTGSVDKIYLLKTRPAGGRGKDKE